MKEALLIGLVIVKLSFCTVLRLFCSIFVLIIVSSSFAYDSMKRWRRRDASDRFVFNVNASVCCCVIPSTYCFVSMCVVDWERREEEHGHQGAKAGKHENGYYMLHFSECGV
jgi:hypothetical protein